MLVPEHTDVDITYEYNHIKQWARNNRMVINEVKTKEVVFHKPCPQKFHMGPPVDAVERVSRIKLLGCYSARKFQR